MQNKPFTRWYNHQLQDTSRSIPDSFFPAAAQILYNTCFFRTDPSISHSYNVCPLGSPEENGLDLHSYTLEDE